MAEISSIFIGATGQNVGKTTICLGLIAALKKRLSRVGFIKPVGQEHVVVEEGLKVDKDAVLFKTQFSLDTDWSLMSPVIIPPGFTRQYLDGEVSSEQLEELLTDAYRQVTDSNDYTVVEGTGHIGVGSIIDLNNAKVAAILGLEMVIICLGGLGSAFDELMLNLSLCEKYGVKVRGVILNRVLVEKQEMIACYFRKALAKRNIPLLGVIPFDPLLNQATFKDFEQLFKTEVLAGGEYRYRHFTSMRLVAGSLESYLRDMAEEEMIITPASREDIILATIEKCQNSHSGMVLTGRQAPTPAIIKAITGSDIPALYAPICSYDAMRMITSFIAKIRLGDHEKIKKAIEIVEENVAIDRLLRR